MLHPGVAQRTHSDRGRCRDQAPAQLGAQLRVLDEDPCRIGPAKPQLPKMVVHQRICGQDTNRARNEHARGDVARTVIGGDDSFGAARRAEDPDRPLRRIVDRLSCVLQLPGQLLGRRGVGRLAPLASRSRLPRGHHARRNQRRARTRTRGRRRSRWSITGSADRVQPAQSLPAAEQHPLAAPSNPAEASSAHPRRYPSPPGRSRSRSGRGTPCPAAPRPAPRHRPPPPTPAWQARRADKAGDGLAGAGGGGGADGHSPADPARRRHSLSERGRKRPARCPSQALPRHSANRFQHRAFDPHRYSAD